MNDFFNSRRKRDNLRERVKSSQVNAAMAGDAKGGPTLETGLVIRNRSSHVRPLPLGFTTPMHHIVYEK